VKAEFTLFPLFPADAQEYCLDSNLFISHINRTNSGRIADLLTDRLPWREVEVGQGGIEVTFAGRKGSPDY
jgi:hypothetical protein